MRIAILSIFIILFCVNHLFAQAPEAFNYQGVALDVKGVPVASKQISLRISILQGSSSGTEVLKETHTPTTDKYGQFSVAIGQGTSVSGSMSSIQWGSNSHYLKAEIDVDGGSNYVNVGTSQLLSVPYALSAAKSSILSDSLGNTKVGTASLNNNTSGNHNTATGFYSLLSNTTGYYNTAFGWSSLIGNTTGNENTAIGQHSLAVNSTGSMNTAIGRVAAHWNKTGSRNTALGYGTLFSNYFGISNTAVGIVALQNAKDSFNTALGDWALGGNRKGNYNLALGYQAGVGLDSGSNNIFIGSNAGNNSVFGNENNRLIIANSNTATPLIYGEFDNKKLKVNGDLEVNGRVLSDSQYNTMIGTGSLANLASQDRNTYCCQGNSAFGVLALNANTTGIQNTSMGWASLQNNQTGMNNTAIGVGSLGTITGDHNTAIGAAALASNQTGSRNTAIGSHSGMMDFNGFNNTFLGSFADFDRRVRYGDLNNVTVIGDSATVSTSNTVSLGNHRVTKWVFGIPTTTDPGYAFQVGDSTNNGNGAYLTNGGTWTNASSRDFKENFEDIDGADLLDRIGKMKVQKWSYKGTDEVHVGPVAEEFKSLFNLGVKDDNKHISTLDASGVALRAIQQLNAENNKLKVENISLKNKYQSLEERLIKLEQLINTLTTSNN